MDWQETVALSIVGITAGVFLWARLRPRSKKLHCGSQVGCPAMSRNSNPPSIIYHVRNGEKPTITVKG